ncbi:DNA alkylation repair protein [Methanobacterium alkalithermotolerans]|uniref:DNA alkylation repair protein n=1 Tax=Methanobacterium alkalithermotolerans TaxID=2731220 RepID=A0A8T8K6I1_9EURY|nr:DNA alkylation repair protein [Methanobacterium alkalithermotolerans]QUH23095.1 DNA alkylation repair protein [Methanobacterium alkalithermotolerans]RJS48041.1 MAG: DNA alkylation repair protein [Methanobacterium sp.]
MDFEEIIKNLQDLSNPEEVEGMARFGINPEKTFAVRIPELRKIAKQAGKDHLLAQKLWDAGYRETRIIASIIEVPEMVTSRQMDRWAHDFDTWDICDQCCMNLFRKTPFAYQKIREWSNQEEEFVKRAAFVLIATLAVHDKKASDNVFLDFFPLILKESTDGRNFVKKAINWALRQIGKRNLELNKQAIEFGRKMKEMDSKSAQWIAKDALKELESEKIQNRLQNK